MRVFKSDRGAEGEVTWRTLSWLPAIAIGVWWRGPFFGLAWGGIVIGLCWLVGRLLTQVATFAGVRMSNWHWMWGPLITSVVVHLMLRPAGPDQIFRDLTGGPVPATVKHLRYWCFTWTKDPGYYFRFEIEPDDFQTLLTSLPNFSECNCHQANIDPGRPNWFQPNELKSPRCWARTSSPEQAGVTY